MLFAVIKNDANIKKAELVKALVKMIAEKWDERDKINSLDGKNSGQIKASPLFSKNKLCKS